MAETAYPSSFNPARSLSQKYEWRPLWTMQPISLPSRLISRSLVSPSPSRLLLLCVARAKGDPLGTSFLEQDRSTLHALIRSCRVAFNDERYVRVATKRCGG